MDDPDPGNLIFQIILLLDVYKRQKLYHLFAPLKRVFSKNYTAFFCVGGVVQ